MRSMPFLTTGRAMAMAHRGDTASHPPGNTWAALAAAVDAGFDHIETDVQLSADGRVVIFHDDTLDEATTGSGSIGEHTWADLQQIRYRTAEGSDEGLVAFDDALDRWPGIHWNVDAKESEVVGPLLELVMERGAIDRVLLTSFSLTNVRRLRSLAPPGLATGLSMVEVAAVRAASFIGLTPPVGGDAAQVPERKGVVPIVDRRFVETCHRSGIAVHVWTVNEADAMHRLLDLGVDGIITDNPRTLRDVLLQRGAWVPIHRSGGERGTT